jgi:hypothetical protein
LKMANGDVLPVGRKYRDNCRSWYQICYL